MADIMVTSALIACAAVLRNDKGVDAAIAQLRDGVSETVDWLRTEAITDALRAGTADAKTICIRATEKGCKIHQSSAAPLIDAMIERGEVTKADEVAGTKRRVVYTLVVT